MEALKDTYDFVVALPMQGPLVQRFEALGAEVIVMPLGVLRRKYFNIPGLISRVKTWFTTVRVLKKLVKEKQVKLIYTNTLSVLVGGFLARQTGLKLLWHIHEIIERPRPLRSFLGKMVNSTAHRAIVVSQAVYDCWSPLISEEKLLLIHNGHELMPKTQGACLRKSLGIPEDHVILASIGRIHPVKGLDYFIDIAKTICHKYDHVHFIIIGDAFPGHEYLYEEMAQQISKYGLEERVQYLGFRDDVPEVLDEIDIFVLPSTGPDSFPTVVLEAMAKALPVVATRMGGALEMVEDGQTGVLIPINEAERAAGLMANMIEKTDLRQQMGEAGRERLTQLFSRSKYDEQIRQVLHELCSVDEQEEGHLNQ